MYKFIFWIYCKILKVLSFFLIFIPKKTQIINKNIVIIGGGFSGRLISNIYKNNCILIDKKEWFEFTPSILKTFPDPNYIKEISYKYNDKLESKFINDIVINIDEKYVYTITRKIEFDYLVICPGCSTRTIPIKNTSVPIYLTKNYCKCYQDLEKSDKILIIGAGIVGIELAAEIYEKFPEKNIILIGTIISNINKNAINYIKKHLEKITIIENEKILKVENNIFYTDKNRQIKSDIAFLSTGITPNSEIMENNMSKYLNKDKYIKVNEYLQLTRNIFACGDIIENNFDEKLSQNAIEQAKNICKNIYNLEKNIELIPYKNSIKPILISLGSYEAIFLYKNWIITGFIPACLKKFVEWKELNF